MVPKTIKREHIVAALAEIDQHGVLAGRQSMKFVVVYKEKKYPPKYVLSLAAKYATGTLLPPDSFGGGNEANAFLRERGFDVLTDSGIGMPPVAAKPPRKVTPNDKKGAAVFSHNERCPECKDAVKALLEVIYGTVQRNPKVEATTNPEDYKQSPLYPALHEIYIALQQHRGYKDFVRTPTMPNCDFWIPNPGFILEFDESQHFTACRALALERYPGDFFCGFDRDSWLRSCRTIAAEDHDPPFRDEQRAWYDTLRDFVPHAKGFYPTLRLFASEFQWCKLKADVSRDVETFRQILAERANFWKLEFSHEAFPVLARVAIDGPWRGDASSAQRLLEDICEQWPEGKQVNCLTTCGAFLRFDWPENLPEQSDNRFPNPEAMTVLESEGRKCCERVLKAPLMKKLRTHADYLTVGVDSFKEKISVVQAHIPEPHAELVFVVDLRSGTYHFTAKSYPTPGQEKGLLRNTNLQNHFLKLNGTQTMVLGCHDLTIFNPRSDAKATGWRSNVKQNFKVLSEECRPRWVLHHPHTAIKRRTWLASWSGLIQALPSVADYVGSGAYSRKDKGWDERDGVHVVLASTKKGKVMDVVVRMALI
jgi:hypothetical protein